MKTTTKVLLRLLFCVPIAVVGFCYIVVGVGDDSFCLNLLVKTMGTSDVVICEITVLGAYTLFIAAVVAFALWPLWRKKLPKNDGITGAANVVIAVSLCGALLYMSSPQSAVAQQPTVKSVIVSIEKPGQAVSGQGMPASLAPEEQQAVDDAVGAALANFPNGFNRNGGVYQVGIKVTLIACLIYITVVVIVAIGGYIIYKKVKKFCLKLKKKVKDQQEDPDEGTNTTNKAMFRLPSSGLGASITEYAALFNAGYIPQTPEDEIDCGCGPANAILYYTVSRNTLAESGGSMPISAYRPQNPVDEEDYLVRHGLSTNNTVNSYSFNRQNTTNALTQIVLDKDQQGITVTSGETNTVTTAVYWSTNLVNWEILPLSRMKVPILEGTNEVRVILEDGITGNWRPQVFYKLRVVQ
jgi:hypothetical protein